MMKKISVLLFLSLISIAFSQSKDQVIPTDPKVRIGTLDNGMTYYIKHNGYPENKVELRLAINAGSVLETDEQQGLAHFMEHMNFNGTKNFPKNKLVDYLQSLGIEFGADLNAYTSFNETVYMLPVPLDKEGNLDSGLMVLEDWAFNALLETQDIEDERGVILEEKRLRDGANSRMLDVWLPIAYKDSRYAQRLPIGKEEILKNFDPEQIRKFKNDWYRPNLMALVVVGDIDVDEIEKKIKSNFSKYKNPKNPKERKYYDIPNYSSPNVAIASDDEAPFTSAQIQYFNPKPSQAMKTVEDYKKHLAHNLFSQMLNMRYQELANSDTPPFNYAYSYYGSTFSNRKEAFTCLVSSSPDKIGEAFQAMLWENQRVKLHGFVASELERAKSELLSRMEKQFNNRDKIESERWVSQYINNYLEQEPIPSVSWEYESYQKLLPSISLKEVNSLIDTFIQESNFSTIITGPKKVLDKAQITQMINESKMAKLDPYVDSGVGLALMNDLPKAGNIKNSSSDNTMGTQTLELDNGIKVVYKKTDHKDDEILFKASSYGGYSLVSDSDWEKTHFAMGGLPEAGINGLSNSDIDKLLSGKNVRLSPFVSSLSEGMTGNSSQKDLETLFQMIHLYFTSLNYNENAFASFKQKQQGLYGSLMNNPEYFFYNEYNKFVNQNDPRNGNIIPLKADWEILDYKLAYDIYKQRFANPADFTFYFVGSIDENKFKALAKQYLSSLATTPQKEEYKEVEIKPLLGLNEKIVKRGSDTKSLVIMNYDTPSEYSKKEAMAMKMIGEILSIKLIEVLREDEAGVYSVRAYGNMSRGINASASLTANIPTGVEQYEKMQQLTLKEIEKLKKEGPQEADLNKVKESLKNDYKDNIQTNKYWLNLLEKSDFYKEDPTEALKYEEFVSSFSTAYLKDIINKYVGENLTIGILIPEVVSATVEKVEATPAAKLDKVTVTNQPKSDTAAEMKSDLSVQEVIESYAMASASIKNAKKAIKALKEVKSFMRKGKMNVSGIGIDVTMTLYYPIKMEMIMDMSAMGQGKIKTVNSPEESFMEINGEKKELPMKNEDVNFEEPFPIVFFSPDELSISKEVEGDTTYYVLTENKTDLKYFINSDTFMNEKTVYKGLATTYSNFQIIDGFKVPMTIQLPNPQMGDLNINFSSGRIE